MTVIVPPHIKHPPTKGIRPGGCIPPFPVPAPGGRRPGRKVEVSSNDPTLHAKTSNNGRTVVLKGEASNKGIAASVLTLKFDGKTVKVPLSAGMTAWEVRDAVGKKLPKGYSLQLPRLFGRPNTRYASFEIVKDLKPRCPPRPDTFQGVR